MGNPHSSIRCSLACERRRRILVVDDNPDVCESMKDLLEAAGFEVTCTHGGRAALAYLRDHGAEAADVILLDYAMGDLTGPELVAALGSQPDLAPIPVVFVTGDPRARGAVAASGHDCLVKPLEIDDLVAVIERQERRCA